MIAGTKFCPKLTYFEFLDQMQKGLFQIKKIKINIEFYIFKLKALSQV